MSRLLLWRASAQPTPISGSTPFTLDGSPLALHPLEPRRPDALAVLLVGRAADARRNGLALEPGLHLVRHADRVDAGPLAFWVAADCRPEETVYAPPRHPGDAFCARLRARLEPGEDIVICQGRPERACGLLYRKSAWLARPVCASCGANAADAQWCPPGPVERGNDSARASKSRGRGRHAGD